MNATEWADSFVNKTEAWQYLTNENIDGNAEIIREQDIWSYIRRIYKDSCGDLDSYPFHIIDWDETFQRFREDQFVELNFNGETWYAEIY